MDQIEKNNRYNMLRIEMNKQLQTKGYWLSEEDVTYLQHVQKQACQLHEMIDFDSHIIFELANTFKDSPYIRIDTFVYCIEEALYIYYGVRRRSHELYDHEIVQLLYEQYVKHHGIWDIHLLKDCVKEVTK